MGTCIACQKGLFFELSYGSYACGMCVFILIVNQGQLLILVHTEWFRDTRLAVSAVFWSLSGLAFLVDA